MSRLRPVQVDRSLVGGSGRSSLFVWVVVTLVVAVSMTACEPPPPPNPPFWHPGTSVDATTRGPLVRIEWDATTGGNAPLNYQINLGTINGTVVTLVPASTRACDITGLAASTGYTIVVTARDATQAWSGSLPGTQGNRTTTITTTGHGSSGTLGCHPVTDADQDGLSNALETDDGTWSSASDAGTDPNVADTDNDGISDGDETLGLAGPNLIASGARPTHKDLLVETDWISHAPCSTRPTAASLSPAVTGFANAPVANPDGTTGIKLIVDYGQGGPFTGGNQVPDPDATLDGQLSSSNPGAGPFVGVKAGHFAPNRAGIYRYSIAHSGGSGKASGGDDTYIGNQCTWNEADEPNIFWWVSPYAGLFMHEIGHNLGLAHGGTSWDLACDEVLSSCMNQLSINRKPNYVSVVNYGYFDGVESTCRERNDGDPHHTYRLDYSEGGRAVIDENALNESLGICNGVPYDFNRNGIIDVGTYAADITDDGRKTELHDHDDWGYIEDVGLRLFAE